MAETATAAKQEQQQRPRGSGSSFEHLWLESGAVEGSEFLQTWLRLQCEFISGTRVGLLVQREPGSSTYRSVASWPGPHGELPRLGKLAQECLSRGEKLVLDDPISVSSHVLFGNPIGAIDGDLPAAAIAVAVDRGALANTSSDLVLRQLHWGGGWIEALEWRRMAAADNVALRQTANVLDYVALAGESPRLASAALAIANELASQLGCERVSIGMIARGQVRLTAISNSATFDRRSKVARAIEGAMEEASHQNLTVAQPPFSADDKAIVIAHRELVRDSGLGAVMTCVLPGRNAPVGALTLERAADQLFIDAERNILETLAVLIGPSLELHLDRERWVAGRGALMLRQWAERLAGPDRPSLKLLAGAVVVLPILLTLIPGEFQFSAKTTLEGEVQRTLVAPFDGFIRDADARAGDEVHAGQVLARLDDRDASLEQTRWRSELQTLQAKYSDAIARHDRTNVMILGAQMRQAQAQLDLANDELSRTRIIAPFNGVVVTGDLRQVLGSPIERGKTLFEVAPLDRYRVVLQVDERDIRYARSGERGTVVLNGLPSEPLPFTVSRVMPVATSEEGRTYFRVEALLVKPDKRLRPGMEGIAHVDAGRRPLLWIWTRTLVDWVRIALWQWLP